MAIIDGFGVLLAAILAMFLLSGGILLPWWQITEAREARARSHTDRHGPRQSPATRTSR